MGWIFFAPRTNESESKSKSTNTTDDDGRTIPKPSFRKCISGIFKQHQRKHATAAATTATTVSESNGPNEQTATTDDDETEKTIEFMYSSITSIGYHNDHANQTTARGTRAT